MKTQSCVFVAFRTDWPKRRRIAKLGAKAQVVVAVVAGAVIQMADLKIDEDLAGQALRADQRYRPAPLVRSFADPDHARAGGLAPGVGEHAGGRRRLKTGAGREHKADHHPGRSGPSRGDIGATVNGYREPTATPLRTLRRQLVSYSAAQGRAAAADVLQRPDELASPVENHQRQK